MRYRTALLAGFIASTVCSWLCAAVPNQPSVVTVQGTQLIVRKRLPDGTLSQPVPYTIKGVDWSPATRAPDTGPLPRGPIPGSSNQYGFFFDWDGRNPQGHELMNYWLSNEHQTYYQTDIPLMAQMHINTVRIYGDFGDDPSVYGPILDMFYNYHIMVVMTIAAAKSEIDSGRYLRVMGYCKNHPAILMFAVGNEWNLNLLYGYSSMAQAAAVINGTVVPAMKALDSNHPVSSSLGDSGVPISTVLNAVPAVDIWAINMYRGETFGNFFTQWTSATSKPIYFSEFGIDSFKTTQFTLPGGGQAKVQAGEVDPVTQANWDFGLWKLIEAQLSSRDSTLPCAGGFVFSWSDALWKVGNYNAGLGGLTDESGTSYNSYNPDGFYIPGGFPDNVDNEEYFGIVDADRVPKQAYSVLKSYYAGLAPLPLDSIALAPAASVLTYHQSVTVTPTAYDAFQEELVTTPSISWNVTPSTGVTLSATGVFSSMATPGTYIVSATSGSISSSMTVTVLAAQPPLPLPAANFGRTVAVNGVLSVSLPFGFSADHFEWTFTKQDNLSDTLRFTTKQGKLDLGPRNLPAAPYLVTVQAFDANSTPSPLLQLSLNLVPADFSTLRVFPSPWRSDLHTGHDVTFDGLTANTTVKLFTVSGHWIRTLGSADGHTTWDLKNDAGDLVASGLYFYLITNPQGDRIRGKFAVIR